MQNSSFDSLNLDEYTLDIKEVLDDYIIEKGNLLNLLSSYIIPRRIQRQLFNT